MAQPEQSFPFADGLPIAPLLPEVLTALAAGPNLVLEAPPGAGKSTTVPLALLRDSAHDWRADGLIMVLEPRRVAARAVATRMASLLGQAVGGEVGYRVRHESRTSAETRVMVVTEGVLVRRLQMDPALTGVAAVIFDEFHERNIDADLSLALCREAQKALRPELRLLVMSATLGEALAPAVATLLGDCPALRSEGRAFPVDIKYVGTKPLAMLASSSREIEAEMAAAIGNALRQSAEGDLLAFLPGEREIRNVAALLERSLPAATRIAIRPLYGALPFDQQQAAIMPDPGGQRRVILSTNLAESSLTIEGVRFVVDSGLRRVSIYEAAVGMAALTTRAVSSASADQRAGRAGRVGPGTAFRLWTAAEQARLVPDTAPEIAMSDLAPMLLQIAGWGGSVHDDEVLALPWLTPPPLPLLHTARALLISVGALCGDSSRAVVTTHGKNVGQLPTHPRLAHVLIMSAQRSDAALAVTAAAAAVLEERDVLRGGSKEHGADLRSRVRSLLRQDPDSFAVPSAWWRAKMNRDELTRTATKYATDEPPSRTPQLARDQQPHEKQQPRRGAEQVEALLASTGELLASGYADMIAQRQPGKTNVFSLSNGRGASFYNDKEPLAGAEYLVCVSLDGGDKRSAKIRMAVPVTLEELRRALGERIGWEDAVFLTSDGSVRARKVERLGAIEISQETLPMPPAEKARALLVASLQEKGIKRSLFGGESSGATHPALNLIARVRMLRALEPGGGWPCWSGDRLTDTMEEWLAPALEGATNLKAVTQADTAALLEATLPYEQQAALRRDAPKELPVPSGAVATLEYVRGGDDPLSASGWEEGAAAVPPLLSRKLQEWFGARETPTVGPRGNTLPVLLQLLSPAGAPVALTSDLPSFWSGAYLSVRAELRDKYKRHPWPEDPTAAEPTRLTNRGIAKQSAAEGAAAEGAGGAQSDGSSKKKKRGKKNKGR